MDFREYIELIDTLQDEPEVGDIVEMEFGGVLIETTISDILEDGVAVYIDAPALRLILEEKEQLNEMMRMGADTDASASGTIVREKDEDLDEAEYQGRKVPLGKPMAGDVKKSKVYVRKPNGKVVKVNFGDKKMKIKKSNPKRRKSFRARHNCQNPGPRWKARYWSCRAW